MTLFNYLKPAIVFVVYVSLAACAFVPKVEREQSYAKQCDMYSKALTLDAVSLGRLDCGGSSSCMALAGLIPATTFLVSGSIVLVGNTLHWLEYQGSCDDGMVKTSINWIMPDDTQPIDDANEIDDKERVEDVSIDKTVIEDDGPSKSQERVGNDSIIISD